MSLLAVYYKIKFKIKNFLPISLQRKLYKLLAACVRVLLNFRIKQTLSLIHKVDSLQLTCMYTTRLLIIRAAKTEEDDESKLPSYRSAEYLYALVSTIQHIPGKPLPKKRQILKVSYLLASIMKYAKLHSDFFSRSVSEDLTILPIRSFWLDPQPHSILKYHQETLSALITAITPMLRQKCGQDPSVILRILERIDLNIRNRISILDEPANYTANLDDVPILEDGRSLNPQSVAFSQILEITPINEAERKCLEALSIQLQEPKPNLSRIPFPTSEFQIYGKPFSALAGRYFAPIPTLVIFQFSDYITTLLTTDTSRQSYDKIKGQVLENEICLYLKKIFQQSAYIHTKIPYTDNQNTQGDIDILVEYEDFLIVIEAKGGRLRPQAWRGHEVDFINKYRSLVERANEQCRKTKQYLSEISMLSYYHKESKQTRTVQCDRRSILCLSIFLEPLGFYFASGMSKEIAALNYKESICLYINDFKIIADALKIPTQLISYLEARIAMQNREEFGVAEFNILGLYLGDGAPRNYESKKGQVSVLAYNWFPNFMQSLEDPAFTGWRPQLPESLETMIRKIEGERITHSAYICSQLQNLPYWIQERLGEQIVLSIANPEKSSYCIWHEGKGFVLFDRNKSDDVISFEEKPPVNELIYFRWPFGVDFETCLLETKRVSIQ